MLTLIIIVLILMAICRPRRYRGFGPYHHHHGPFFGPPMGGPRGPHGPMCGGPVNHLPFWPWSKMVNDLQRKY